MEGDLAELNIILCGVGGQGNVVAAEILAMAAVRSGLRVRVGETFGAAQRGGSVMSHVRMGSKVWSPLVPAGACHLLVGLEPCEAVNTALEYLCAGGTALVNSSPFLPVKVKTGEAVYPSLEQLKALMDQVAGESIWFNARELAIEAGNVVAANMVMLGAVAALDRVPVAPEALQKALVDRVGTKWAEVNLRAFGLGFQTALASAAPKQKI